MQKNKKKKGPVVKYYKELHFFYHKIHLFVLKLENEILTALHCMDTDSLENDFWWCYCHWGKFKVPISITIWPIVLKFGGVIVYHMGSKFVAFKCKISKKGHIRSTLTLGARKSVKVKGQGQGQGW